ncbi:protein neprosin-like [Cannabis sativa]|nr:protein neprosin-like [Cannabis sativa]
MEKSVRSSSSSSVIILLMNLVVFFHYAIAAARPINNNQTQTTSTSLDEEKLIDFKLKLLNKPPLKTIKSSDGDIIDCIDIYKQPAFDHPALKNHTIQIKPSSDLLERINDTNSNYSKSVVFQTWQKNGGFCPEGSVPIRRIQRKDLVRLGNSNVGRFGQKNPYVVRHHHNTTLNDTPNAVVLLNDTRSVSLPDLVNRSVALLVTLGYNYIGAQASLNLWNPIVLANEYSTSQIWLKAGIADTFESIESGWVVNPNLYGDTRTRLFVYWTTDGYVSKGCFDLTCSGFVHTNPNVVLGGSLEPCSSQSGPQYELPITITLDPHVGNWWLKVGQDVAVGYWPGTLFGYLQHSAVMVQWGGEVYSPNVREQKPHTTTAMGSGQFARLLHGEAAYVKGVRIMDYSLSLKYPEWVDTWGDEDYCYSAFNEVKYGVEPTFYFGGPGRNSLCP